MEDSLRSVRANNRITPVQTHFSLIAVIVIYCYRLRMSADINYFYNTGFTQQTPFREVLGLKDDFNKSDLNKRFRPLAVVYHTDKHMQSEYYGRILVIFQFLNHKRLQADLFLENGVEDCSDNAPGEEVYWEYIPTETADADVARSVVVYSAVSSAANEAGCIVELLGDSSSGSDSDSEYVPSFCSDSSRSSGSSVEPAYSNTAVRIHCNG